LDGNPVSKKKTKTDPSFVEKRGKYIELIKVRPNRGKDSTRGGGRKQNDCKKLEGHSRKTL